MGQRPTPSTPKFIPEIQVLVESHPDGTAADFLSGNKKDPAYEVQSGNTGYSTPTFTGVGVFYTLGDIRQSENLAGHHERLFPGLPLSTNQATQIHPDGEHS